MEVKMTRVLEKCLPCPMADISTMWISLFFVTTAYVYFMSSDRFFLPSIVSLYLVSISFSRVLVNNLKSCTPSTKPFRSYKMLKINWWMTTGATLKWAYFKHFLPSFAKLLKQTLRFFSSPYVQFIPARNTSETVSEYLHNDEVALEIGVAPPITCARIFRNEKQPIRAATRISVKLRHPYENCRGWGGEGWVSFESP